MPAEKGSQWSKNPLMDRQNDERAIDLHIADQLETAARVLRSRQPLRLQLTGLATNQDAHPLQRDERLTG